jgi:hypothetical protein
MFRTELTFQDYSMSLNLPGNRLLKLREFLNTQARQGQVEWDVKAAEKRVKAILPTSLKPFS